MSDNNDTVNAETHARLGEMSLRTKGMLHKFDEQMMALENMSPEHARKVQRSGRRIVSKARW